MAIGLITKPHGIKGELCVQYYAESPFLLKAPIFIVAPDDSRIIDVTTKSYKLAKDCIILSLDICKDRNFAETLRNYEICIDPIVMRDFLKKHTPSSQKAGSTEEIFIYQLTGLSVYRVTTTPDELNQEKEYIGKVAKADFIAGQEIWTIHSPTGKEILLPAVPEFVHDINIDTQEVLITPPEGLIELYTE